MKRGKGREPTGLEALEAAHRVAVAPFVFQTAASLISSGLLGVLGAAYGEGLTRRSIEEALPEISGYALDVLLEAGTAFGLLRRTPTGWDVTKTGVFLLEDPLVKANFDFTRDVCYKGLVHLDEALREGRPAGLVELGPWKTIYPALDELPEPARSSWFAFDHGYSDRAYEDALPIVFGDGVDKLVDVGGNTGKWAAFCCRHDPDVEVTVFDLPEQCRIVERNLGELGFGARVRALPIDLLTDEAFPATDASVWWMSQFLDCFPPATIVSILKRARSAMKDDARLFILEPLTDRQAFDAARECLAAYSLYFTVMANGTSRFYSLEDFECFLAAAGFVIERVHDGLGTGHTLIACRKAA